MSEPEDASRADVRRILDENPAFAHVLQQFMALYDAAETLEELKAPQCEVAAPYLRAIGDQVMREAAGADLLTAMIRTRPPMKSRAPAATPGPAATIGLALGRLAPSPARFLSLIGLAVHSWFPWFLLACALIVLPVLLRLLVGEDPPDNSVTHEQDGKPEDPGPAAVPAAA